MQCGGGVGTVLTALIGYVYFKEPATALKKVIAGLIVIGVMGCIQPRAPLPEPTFANSRC